MEKLIELKAMRDQEFSREEKKAIQKEYDLPELFCFETTSKCILDCEFCMHTKNQTYKTRRSIFWSFEDFKRVIDQISFFTYYIQLSGGEPLLNKDIFKMIRYARKKRISTWLFTNLQLLNRKNNLYDLVEAQPTRICVALDALDKKVYEHIRRNGDYDVLLSNIKDLIAVKKSTGKDYPLIMLQMVLTKKTLPFEKDFFRVVEELGADVGSIKPLGVWPEGDAAYFDLMRREYMIPEQDHPLVRNFLNENNEIIGHREPGQCASRNIVYMGSGGEVIPCWYIQIATKIMGNAVDTDFLDIWYSAKYRNYRNDMLNGWANPLCRKCVGHGPISITRNFTEAARK